MANPFLNESSLQKAADAGWAAPDPSTRAAAAPFAGRSGLTRWRTEYGIIATAYVPSTVGATALINLGDKRIKMVGIDDDPIVLDAIREGFLVGTMAQNPYGQAYVAAFALDKLRHGCQMNADAPFLIDSGTFLIDPTTVDTYADNLKEITAEIQSGFEANYLTCG